jgi:GT2 family glycosyltransferase
MAKLAVSIVNHNSVEPLRACLRSVLDGAADLAPQVCVVDNLCEQPARAMLRTEFPAVRVLENTRTLGFGANHNQVLRRELDACEFVLLLNPDTALPPGAIHRMLAIMDSHPSVAICGPQLVDPAGTAIPPLRRFLSWPREAFYLSLHLSNANPSPGLWAWLDRGARLARRSQSKAPAEREDASGSAAAMDEPLRQAVSGACMLVRTAALRAMGLFDERFFMYFEDVDLCLRAWSHGWQVAFLPSVQVMHLGGYSTAPRYHDYLGVYVQSCLYLYRKHRGRWAERGLRAWIAAVAIANIPRWSATYVLQPQRRAEIAPWLLFSAQTFMRFAHNRQ